MNRFVRSLCVAVPLAAVLSACATYDYGYAQPYYGYDYAPYSSYS